MWEDVQVLNGISGVTWLEVLTSEVGVIDFDIEREVKLQLRNISSSTGRLVHSDWLWKSKQL